MLVDVRTYVPVLVQGVEKYKACEINVFKDPKLEVSDSRLGQEEIEPWMKRSCTAGVIIIPGVEFLYLIVHPVEELKVGHVIAEDKARDKVQLFQQVLNFL